MNQVSIRGRFKTRLYPRPKVITLVAQFVVAGLKQAICRGKR
jgi:hypothetical protein